MKTVELTDSQIHHIYLALLGRQQELQREWAAGPGGSTDNQLEAYEAIKYVMADNVELLALFKSLNYA